MTQGYLATGQTQEEEEEKKKTLRCHWLVIEKKKQSGREKSKYTEMTFPFHDNLLLLTFLYINETDLNMCVVTCAVFKHNNMVVILSNTLFPMSTANHPIPILSYLNHTSILTCASENV